MQEAIVNMLTPIVAIVGVAFAQCKINMKKCNRSKQALLPFVAFAYSVIAIVVALYYDAQILEKIDKLTSFFGVDFPISFDIMLLNVAVLTVFLAVKGVVNVFLSKVLGDKARILALTESYYEYDDDYSDYFLEERLLTTRSLFQGFVVAGSFITGLILGVIQYMGVESSFYVYVFPVAPMMVLIEIYNFLNGYTKEEFSHNIVGDDSYSQRIGNFYRVREILEKVFPHELLTANTGYDFISSQGVMNLLEDLSKSEDRVEKVVSEFFVLQGKDEKYDADCIQATVKLMKDENVIFFNPFYRDLGKYMILPLLNSLLAGRKCLLVVGRSSTKEDMKQWLSELLAEYGKIRTMWRVRDLSFKTPECEVGVLTFPQLYDLAMIEANADFLKEVGFVIFAEPSLIVNTGQIGLSILSQQMTNNGDTPVYCIFDRQVDGLLDTMSHLLREEITEVTAPPVSRNIHTSMAWNADGDFLRQRLFGKQTKYLGNGVELAAVAIKNQIPSVSWFGETKVPIRDVKWIAGQYYPGICRYMNLPVQQQSIYDKIKFISNIWSVPEENEQFVIAEDEFINIFSTMRTFLSRGKQQTFVNVLSENYLLRDYMRYNPQMFVSNPNAIPSMVPDYAKTERNTLIKLLLIMVNRPVYESEIIAEFRLAGLETEDPLHTLTTLLKKYSHADDTLFQIESVKADVDGVSFNSESVFRLNPEKFEDYFGESLKNAYFICEEEQQGTEFIDAKLFGHVTQVLLPGQFVTYDGKYYVAKHISAKNGVVLRRASNLFAGRKYYRQIRNYIFEQDTDEEVISMRTVMDVEMANIRKNIRVATTGYLESDRNDDLRNARVNDFSNDPSLDVYTRNYRNKTVLRIKLPDTTDKVRFTICMLLQETFRSLFPNAWQYIAAVTVQPEEVDGFLNYTVYGVNGNVEDEYIYIIEDSEIDLGLLETVEKNFLQIMETITDFLYWHFDKMRESAHKDPVVYTPEFPPADKKRRKKFSEMVKRINLLSGGKKKEKELVLDSAEVAETKVEKPQEEPKEEAKTETNKTEAKTETNKTEAVEVSKEKQDSFQPEQDESPDLAVLDGTDIFDTETTTDDWEFDELFRERGIITDEKTRYQSECYLKFGFDEVDGRIKLEEVRRYLTVRGFSDNLLTKARTREVFDKTIIDAEAVNHCDFCGLPLSGVSFERLSDGRIRCNDCSASAITSVEEFKELFYTNLRLMESFYNIEYKVPISVRTADAKAIARGFGSVFTPTTDVAARVLGYAQRKRGQFSLNVENGSPRLATIDTMIHELTHIWQYLNWDDKAIKKAYPDKRNRDIVYEGMAVWSSVQYLYLIGEVSYAAQLEALSAAREDIYGIGFNMYREKFPITKDSALVKYSPFMEFPPL